MLHSEEFWNIATTAAADMERNCCGSDDENLHLGHNFTNSIASTISHTDRLLKLLRHLRYDECSVFDLCSCGKVMTSVPMNRHLVTSAPQSPCILGA